jgi:hypothetical protein
MPYKTVGGDALQQFLPEEVRANSKVKRRIRLFVRRRNEDKYTFVGRLGPCHCYGTGTPGQNFGEAYFDLRPTLPSAVWTRLGGLHVSDLDHGALDATLNRLAGPLPRAARLEVLRQVAEYFHGLIRAGDGMSDDELGGTPTYGPPPLPESLRWWYQLVGKRKGMLCCQNYFLEPAKLEIDVDGKMEFFSENQGVYRWATAATGAATGAERLQSGERFLCEDWVESAPPAIARDDASVWGRFNEVGKPWTEEGMQLSEFLIQVCLFESVMAAPYGASAASADEETLEKVTKPLKELPLPPWHWPDFPTRFFYGGGAFVVAGPNGQCNGKLGYSIWVGAKTEMPLAYLNEIVDERWEYVAC